MTDTVPPGATADPCPPDPGPGWPAWLRVEPARRGTGLRVRLLGPDPDQPPWGHLYLTPDGLVRIADAIGLGRDTIATVPAGDLLPVRIGVERDAPEGTRLWLVPCDRPTPAQQAADAAVCTDLAARGLWPDHPSAPQRLRQLVALVPRDGGERWAALEPLLRGLRKIGVVRLVERPVALDDPADLLAALAEAADLVRWAGADAVLMVTGDCPPRSRTLSDARVVEAACRLGAPLLTLAGPRPTLVDALAWRTSPLPGAVLASVEEVLRAELVRADWQRLAGIANALARPGAGETEIDAPF